jgi:hypothetical protein
MDINLRKCNGCNKLNETHQADWVRINGVELSAAGPGRTQANNEKLDFCPTCAVLTTVDKLQPIAAEVFKSTLPEHMRKHLEAAQRKPAEKTIEPTK